MLTERAKTLLARLSKERLDKSEEVRDYLLQGRLSPRGHGASPPRWPDGSPNFWL